MRVDGCLSDEFLVERDVKQGSVLSPALFLLVMDPLLRQLQASELGLTVNGSMLVDFSMLMTSGLWPLVKHP